MSKKLYVNINEKYYESSSLKVIEDCQFMVEAGEFVTILGPSGCGKSTILKAISGLDISYAGEIFLGNRKVGFPSADCSMIFQESRLLPWLNVVDNICFASVQDKNEILNEVHELLKFLDLLDFKSDFPRSLSGGMSQKVALARGLINLPDLLLLDEPFASLDYITRMQLQEELVRILQRRKVTVLMVTHDIEEAIFCSDRILMMSKNPGKILKSISVNLSRPRSRTDNDFLNFYKKILNEMSIT